MRKLAVGLLAHVDAGKTTLSEAMLYQAGQHTLPAKVWPQRRWSLGPQHVRARNDIEKAAASFICCRL